MNPIEIQKKRQQNSSMNIEEVEGGLYKYLMGMGEDIPEKLQKRY